jgi:cytochrome c oxidase assembly factor CtaG
VIAFRPRTAIVIAAACVVAFAAVPLAEAHGGAPLAPHDATTAWTFDPATLLLISGTTFRYGRGVARVWRSAGRGRGVSLAQVAAFVGSMLAIVAALISPVDALAEELFSVHMAQHLLLMAVAAPLRALSAPAVAFAWGVRREARVLLRDVGHTGMARALGRALATPPAVWLLFAATVWAWHAPPLYDAALSHPAVHALEHASFLAASLLFWSVLVARAGKRHFEFGAAAAFVFLAMLQMSILAALLTLSGRTWYAAYDGGAPAWGLTQLQDQQLAGLLMWIPSNAVFLVAMLVIVARWLDRDARNGERMTARLRQPKLDQAEQGA